jgi:hypothetical protein
MRKFASRQLAVLLVIVLSVMTVTIGVDAANCPNGLCTPNCPRHDGQRSECCSNECCSARCGIDLDIPGMTDQEQEPAKERGPCRNPFCSTCLSLFFLVSDPPICLFSRTFPSAVAIDLERPLSIFAISFFRPPKMKWRKY